MDPFLNACEAGGPLELDVEGRDLRQSGRQVFDQPFALIGRDPRSDLPLVHEQISLRHAYLQIIAGRVFCIDLGSRTGTRWREGRRRFGWLGRRQAIRIGPFRIRLQGGDSASDDGDYEMPSRASILGPDSPRSTALPELTLELRDRNGSEPQIWRMNRVMVLVGTKDICKLRLSDPSVSSLHGCLVRTAMGPWVVDLLGRGGVLVNGRLVRSSRLLDGDTMQIGRYEIRVRCGPPARSALPGPGARPLSLESSVAARAEGPSAMRVWTSDAAAASLPAPETARVELVPFAQGALPALEGVSDSVALPLLNQFGIMQQQMFDQFQQTMMMMAQMFTTMHRDQSDMIRGEFARLNELNQEIESIKADLAKLALIPPVHTSAPIAGPSNPVREMSQPQADAPARVAPVRDAAATPASEGASEMPRPMPSGSTHAGTAPPNPAESSEYLLRLHQRLASIQEERQTRWQKLLSLVPGFTREEPVP
jgi:pSer/pThr/pTyr-binding forkhead associated (FHA) protein